MENVGGRLLLRFEGTDKAKDDFWLFYLHRRLHPIGWCKDNEVVYKPPEGPSLSRNARENHESTNLSRNCRLIWLTDSPLRFVCCCFSPVIHKDHPEPSDWHHILDSALKEAESTIQPANIFDVSFK